MAKITDPFSNRPVNPFPSGSPLAETARQHGGVVLQSVEEQYRSALLTAAHVPGNAPTFTPTPTPAPFTPTTAVPVQPAPQVADGK